jgi:hypothetical protein
MFLTHRVLAIVIVCVAGLAARGGAQATPDSASCDALVGGARVDSVPVGIFASARRMDGPLGSGVRRRMALSVGAGFVPPVPLRLSVFSGPALTHVLRTLRSDSVPEPRAPSITGVYRVVSSRSDSGKVQISIIRSSLIIGWDSAAINAIREATVVKDLFTPPNGEDTMHVDIRMSTDSTLGADRLASAIFPRLPVIDAAPLPGNPPGAFPKEVNADGGLTQGEVVLRFVVNRTGEPAREAVEIVRATSQEFAVAALEALPKQRFRPATIKGCPVAQVIDYPFIVVSPTDPPG